MAGEDSTTALLAALRARLLADPAVAALVGGRVYDQAPDDVAFPFVQIGDVETLPFEGQGLAGLELLVTIRILGRPREAGEVPVAASAQVLRVNAAVRDCLHGQPFPVDGHTLRLFEHRITRHLRDPDGRTRHALAEYRCLTTVV